MEIRADGKKGLGYTEIARKHNMDPRTAKKYAASSPRPEYALTDPKPSKLDACKRQADIWPEEAPHSAARMHEKLAGHGFDGKYGIVKEYVRGKKKDLNEKAAVRFETVPGLQARMDWGFFEDRQVVEDGKVKKLYCFLMILGFSRMRYIKFITDMSTGTLIRCHQNAFRYWGGYP